MTGTASLAFGDALAVVVARDGRLPVGSDEAVAEAGGTAIVVGTDTENAARALVGALQVHWAETGGGLRPASLVHRLAPLVGRVPLLVLPTSPDGRDLAPRLAAALGRPLIAGAVSVQCRPSREGADGYQVSATVSRLDDRVLVTVDVDGPAVVTLVPGTRTVTPSPTPAVVGPMPEPGRTERETSPGGGAVGERAEPERADPEVVAVLDPDLHTMDLAEASRVVAGGAGLAAGSDDRLAVEVFDLLVQVAAALGGSAGATRVATDAGWTGYERQIGTTGVAIDPDLYIALGVSGATQHVGGLGTPRHIISVNTDPASPMTAMADLGLVSDARALLVELGRRFGLDVADDLAADTTGDARAGAGHA